MTGPCPDEQPLKLKLLLGVGLDGSPEEKRITRGPNFRLYGGSEETHQRMLETAVKFNEKVDARGKRLDEVSRRDMREIAGELREEIG
jgi:hypothetical protein